MAKEEEKQTTEAPTEASAAAAEDSQASEGGKGGLLGLAITALIVVVLAAGIGFGLGKFINAPSKAEASEDTTEPQEEQDVPSPDSSAQNQKYDYYTFEKITGNLDDPRMTRYIIVTIKLAMKSDDKEKSETLIVQEKPRLTNWLRTYFTGCTVDDFRGPKKMNRIRREICDRFNELLWPGKRPLIREVLFSEFAIQ